MAALTCVLPLLLRLLRRGGRGGTKTDPKCSPPPRTILRIEHLENPRILTILFVVLDAVGPSARRICSRVVGFFVIIFFIIMFFSICPYLGTPYTIYTVWFSFIPKYTIFYLIRPTCIIQHQTFEILSTCHKGLLK